MKQHLLLLIVLASASSLAGHQGKILVPAGEFKMGCSAGDDLCDRDEGPQGGVTVYVEAFYIDVHETSVAEYRQCVEQGQCKKPFTFRRTHYLQL